MRDIDPDTVRLARAIMGEPTLGHLVAVAAGVTPASPAARRHVVDAIAELEAEGHPASAALRLAIEAAPLKAVLS